MALRTRSYGSERDTEPERRASSNLYGLDGFAVACCVNRLGGGPRSRRGRPKTPSDRTRETPYGRLPQFR